MTPRYQPPDASLAPRYTGIRTFARFPHVPDELDRRRRRGDRRPVRHRDDDAARRSLRAGRDPGRLDAPAAVEHGPARQRVRRRSRSSTAATCTSRPATPRRPRSRSPTSSSPSSEPESRRSSSAATTRSCSASCGRTPRSTGRSRSCCSTRTPTPGRATTASATSTALRSSGRCEEGLIDPHRSLLAGMRGSLYAASDLDEPRDWGFEIVSCDELRTWTPEQYAAAGEAADRRRPRVPLASTSTRSTRRSPPGPARRRWPGLLIHEAIAFLRSLRGIAVHRLRHRRGRARLRHARPDDRAAPPRTSATSCSR